MNQFLFQREWFQNSLTTTIVHHLIQILVEESHELLREDILPLIYDLVSIHLSSFQQVTLFTHLFTNLDS